MAARNFQLGEIVGDYGDLGQSVMAIDCTGQTVLLASKRNLLFVNLDNPSQPDRLPRKNVRWDIYAAQWNPHEAKASEFVVTRNQVADVCVRLNGRYEINSTLKSHTRSITDLDWSPSDCNLLLSCSADSNSFLWDTRMPSIPSQTYETSQSCSASQIKWNKVRFVSLAVSTRCWFIF